MMASQKKTIDVIGSIDDYALEPPQTETPTRIEEDSWERPKIVLAEKGMVLAGDELTPVSADPSFIVGENRWGDKKVWPLKPYCVSCSPAAKKMNDDEQVSSFDEMGAERTMSARKSVEECHLHSIIPFRWLKLKEKSCVKNVIIHLKT